MRKFGIELEYVGPRARLTEELRNVGVPVDSARSHLGWSENSWTNKMDGSVNGSYDGNGGELVSPPLDFDTQSDRDKVTRAVLAMQLAGCRPDDSCGIHVHIDASDLTAYQVANVGRFFAKFEDVIYRIASSGWQRIRPSGMNNYCRPLDPSVVRGLVRVRTEDDFLRTWYGGVVAGQNDRRDHHHGSRYHGLNLHSWAYQGTIEFRIFNSSVNPDRIQAYIALCVAIVQDAREGFSRRPVGKGMPLGAMARGDLKPESAILRLQQVLRTNSKDTKILMSKEDWKRLRMCWKDSTPQAPSRW